MLSFLHNPKLQVQSALGKPLSGGLLYTYASGTTTNKATYPTVADAIAEKNANTNPIVLNSRGENQVVLHGPTKLVLKDSEDNTLWTQDAVEPNTTLLDTNGKVILYLTSTAAAVNNVEISNAATGFGPTIKAVGDNLNVSLYLSAKGTGNVAFNSFGGASITNIPGTSSAQGKLRIYEQTTNGTNYVEFVPPASLTTNYSNILPPYVSTSTILSVGSTGTLTFLGAGTAGYLMQTDGAAGINWVSAEATQTELEAASSTTKFTSPAKQMYHPSAAKFWVKCNFSGSSLIGYNVSSVSDTGTGIVTIQFSTNFSSSDYAMEATGGHTNCRFVVVQSVTTSSIILNAMDDTNNFIDPNFYCAVGFGDRS